MYSARELGSALAVLLAFLSTGTHGVAANEPSRSQLSIRIVPTSSEDKVGRWLELDDDGSKHFHVVVTNVSSEPVKVWKEWCSWGYFNLTFEARDAAGKIVVISKRPRDWTKNFPCPVEIEASGHMVIDVSLAPAIWQNSPLSDESGRATLRLKAVYEIRDTKESKQENVWTGRISSPEAAYTISWKSATAKQTLQRLQNVKP